MMSTGLAAETYLDVGLEVLAERGYGSLKLAVVCNRVGVTTGAFYHHFANWSTYTRALVEHWRQRCTLALLAEVRGEADPRVRIDRLITIGLELPHRAESAIRAWSSVDADVHAAQADVDRQRHAILRESAIEILHEPRQADLFAQWALYLLIGYEQATIPDDLRALQWLVAQLVSALDTGRFATVPDPI
jgi:AcrR family transcriptional regulator